jgi:hypothetical protein
MGVVSHVLRLCHVLEVVDDLAQRAERLPEFDIAIGFRLPRECREECLAGIPEGMLLEKEGASRP